MTPTLSLTSLMASSPVCSPHSDSCVAMLTRSRPADSWAPTTLLDVLISLYSLRDSSGWMEPRSEDSEKPTRWDPPPPPEDEPVPPLVLPERMERLRCLQYGQYVCGLGHS